MDCRAIPKARRTDRAILFDQNGPRVNVFEGDREVGNPLVFTTSGLVYQSDHAPYVFIINGFVSSVSNVTDKRQLQNVHLLLKNAFKVISMARNSQCHMFYSSSIYTQLQIYISSKSNIYIKGIAMHVYTKRSYVDRLLYFHTQLYIKGL